MIYSAHRVLCVHIRLKPGLPLERRCPADPCIWPALRAWTAIDRAAARSPLGSPPITAIDVTINK